VTYLFSIISKTSAAPQGFRPCALHMFLMEVKHGWNSRGTP
jgi:hypothetical protein